MIPDSFSVDLSGSLTGVSVNSDYAALSWLLPNGGLVSVTGVRDNMEEMALTFLRAKYPNLKDRINLLLTDDRMNGDY